MSNYLTISFPVTDDTDKGYLFKRDKTNRESIKSKIILLIMTPKGQRWYNPNYGSNLRRFLFEPNDNITTFDIEQDIRDSVSKFIKNVTINSVTFLTSETDPNIGLNTVEMNLVFTYNEGTFSETDELNLTFTV